MSSPSAQNDRHCLEVRGLVQGVGFRPYVCNLARELGLGGWVRNHTAGVTIEVEGPTAVLAQFAQRLLADLPPPAQIDTLDSTDVAPLGEATFEIAASEHRPGGVALVLPDLAVCADCRRELRTPSDRRFGYPFINCTHCGPRFTIVREVPYDRPNTTMRGFTLCADCAREYHDPADRRFHAQPNACGVCGPRVSVLGPTEPGPSQTPLCPPLVRGEVLVDRSSGAAAAAELGAAQTPLWPPLAWGQDLAEPSDSSSTSASEEVSADASASTSPLAKGGPRGVGPSDHQGQAEPNSAALTRAAALLDAGAILAVKGLGGYHLACDAGNEAAVTRLRERKHREARPLAVMVADLAAAEQLGHVGPAEAVLLTSPAAPIVLLQRRPDAPLAPGVAPGVTTIGVMLAYSPLHILLLDACGGPLVMTSGNRTDEPIAHVDDDAHQRLDGIADAFLTHDRPIQRRCDDSVVMVLDGQPLPLRRSRGYAPAPLRLSRPAGEVILAVGAHQKNTFCLLRGDEAFLSHHLGDLENEPALTAFETGIADFQRLFALRPQVLAHDLHPDYLATRYAIERARADGLELVPVQHHHAHIAACLADNDHDGPALGVAFDGTGLGPDGTIWGGEVLLAEGAGYRRVGHLHPFRLAGGEAAVRQGWRVALDLLAAAGLEPKLPGEPAEAEFVRQMLARDLRCVPTTSAGRLFDAFSALLGLRLASRYEGEAAVALEGACASDAESLPFDVACEAEGWRLDWRPAVRTAFEKRTSVPLGELAAGFHRGLAEAVLRLCEQAAEATGVRTVALSGGCLVNRRLAESLVDGLQRVGLSVLRHRRVPPNDGGVSLGQAVVARAWREG